MQYVKGNENGSGVTELTDSDIYDLTMKSIKVLEEAGATIVYLDDFVKNLPVIPDEYLPELKVLEKIKPSKKEIEENIVKRDKLQEEAGYYKIHDNTIVIDVTECKNIEESTIKVMEKIKLPELI